MWSFTASTLTFCRGYFLLFMCWYEINHKIPSLASRTVWMTFNRFRTYVSDTYILWFILMMEKFISENSKYCCCTTMGSEIHHWKSDNEIRKKCVFFLYRFYRIIFQANGVSSVGQGRCGRVIKVLEDDRRRPIEPGRIPFNVSIYDLFELFMTFYLLFFDFNSIFYPLLRISPLILLFLWFFMILWFSDLFKFQNLSFFKI